MAIVQNYSEHSTIQGISHLTNLRSSFLEKFIWTGVVGSFIVLGIYWSVSSYLDWKKSPVITTVSTSAFSISEVDFPTFTICGQGMNTDVLQAGFFKEFFNYLENEGFMSDLTPLLAAQIVDVDMDILSLKKQKSKVLLNHLMQNYLVEYVNATFPGLLVDNYMNYTSNITSLVQLTIDLIRLMASKSPDSVIASMAFLDDNYNLPCSNLTLSMSCDPGFILDVTSGVCYMVLKELLNFDSAKYSTASGCPNYYADVITLDDNNQTQELLRLLNKGVLSLPENSSGLFYLSAYPGGGNYASTNTSFPTILFESEPSFVSSCYGLHYSKNATQLELMTLNCDLSAAVICKSFPVHDSSNANRCHQSMRLSRRKGDKPVDYLLNPTKKIEFKKAFTTRRRYLRHVFKKLNQTSSFESLFSILWYSTLPCHDVVNVTADIDGEKSILKYCSWKGKQLPCASIFVKFPTDQGLCCSFNMRSAEELFVEDEYSKILAHLHHEDYLSAFLDVTPPKWYVGNNEPKSQQGVNMGLTVILDAHTDIVGGSSIYGDFKGFKGLVSTQGSFPFVYRNGFVIQPGYNNLIALSATSVLSNPDLRTLSPLDRNCRFHDEASDLKIYKEYTQANCILECSLNYAQDKLRQTSNFSCTPWFFPTPLTNPTVCDPWQTAEFLSFTSSTPDNLCMSCLPSCSTTTYRPYISVAPFRRCDDTNLYVSPLCDLDDTTLPDPKLWAQEVLNEYGNDLPDYVSGIKTRERFYLDSLNGGIIFGNLTRKYDAYTEDIAMVQVFFDRASIFLFRRDPSQTWIGYMSTVGGLLGLCVGVSFISLCELVWLAAKIFSKLFQTST